MSWSGAWGWGREGVLDTGVLMAQSTLPKLRTSTDLCPMDLGDGVSSRAEFLGLGMRVCSHKEKSQRKIRFQRLEKYLFFGDCLQLSVYTVKGNNTIFWFWFYKGSKTSNYKGWRKEGRGPELLFHGVVRPLLGKLRHVQLRRTGILSS